MYFGDSIVMNKQHSKLEQLVIRVRNREEVQSVFQAICGSKPEPGISAGEGTGFTRFNLGAANVELVEPLDTSRSTARDLANILDSRGPGIHFLGLTPVNFQDCINSLSGIDVHLMQRDETTYVDPNSTNGVLLRLTRGQHENQQDAGSADFDHVAIRVRDLAAASRFWERVTGAHPQHMGIHPVSDGGFEATRFILSNQMIELISPVEGKDSVVATRLRTHGEGVQTVALIARNLEATLERIRETGARLLWQEPHWFVHPGDAAGLLIQLTPRVDH